jgi:hypothetical protein
MKDLEELSNEKRKKRISAEELQTFIKAQIREATKAKEVQKKEKHRIPIENMSILPLSLHNNLRTSYHYDDRGRQKAQNSLEICRQRKSQKDLHRYLEHQVRKGGSSRSSYV